MRRTMRRKMMITPRERLEWWLLPKVCFVVGHKPKQKMYCTICRRCSTVLEER